MNFFKSLQDFLIIFIFLLVSGHTLNTSVLYNRNWIVD